ncbi:MAG: DUF2520 domain-containing protein [Bacteroidales bacterium]|jgi:predicted short-subunit dehydrogenase-like oxidoreductase (DUF2520 family)|nr:DUF2520 domain-containing protein [Bacteroidales bacterium]
MKHHAISFIGAGRVAGALCTEFFTKGYRIEKIVSRSAQAGSALARSCNAVWSDTVEFSDITDIIFVAVSDSNTGEVLEKLQCGNKTIVAHTAASFGLEVFPERIKRKAVFYPLQTFSHGRKIDFNGLPVFIESSDETISTVMQETAEAINARILFFDSQSRRMLHLAAVIVSNFTNHLMAKGKDIAEKSGFSFEELKPLIAETVSKAFDNGPENSQTGPAERNDMITVAKHLELLSCDADMEKIYRDISASIMHYNK